ncbi:hypothetical protein A2617_02760 [Candidatus Daviesbacteria bacterium RIFOXYD1_FULL_41_10]|uniref:Uncharacterized protein n=1 Tax=Candidatus Daviesbacteria bacterium RIFOXYD1_FULL_41_10 TaxID=1797801 RepID=A0A1F5N3C8_9BACT|nr:MAG: hypothetical protein A2617_02760 [Candidatus Daviesbacteria bacterium RIFOXYD1_FULL_41_10]
MANKVNIVLPSYFKYFKIFMLLPGITLIIYLLSIILGSQDSNISQLALTKFVTIRNYIYLAYLPLFLIFLVVLIISWKNKEHRLVISMHEIWLFWGFILAIFSYFIASQLSNLIRNFLH